VEELINVRDRIEKFKPFVDSHNYEREDDETTGMTPVDVFVKCLKRPVLTH
jgi:hypothetical protein